MMTGNHTKGTVPANNGDTKPKMVRTVATNWDREHIKRDDTG